MKSVGAFVAVVILLIAGCSSAEDEAFPTGTFWSPNGVEGVEFNEDGSCLLFGEFEDEDSAIQTYEVPCKYAVNGDLYTEMWFDWPEGPYFPATYFWSYDGETLSFELWGEDAHEVRRIFYTNGLSRTETG